MLSPYKFLEIYKWVGRAHLIEISKIERENKNVGKYLICEVYPEEVQPLLKYPVPQRQWTGICMGEQ